MSRQNKLRKKRTARQVATHEVLVDDKGKTSIGQRKKGPRVPWGQPGGRK